MQLCDFRYLHNPFKPHLFRLSQPEMMVGIMQKKCRLKQLANQPLPALKPATRLKQLAGQVYACACAESLDCSKTSSKLRKLSVLGRHVK
jgi:hypothetical protein